MSSSTRRAWRVISPLQKRSSGMTESMLRHSFSAAAAWLLSCPFLSISATQLNIPLRIRLILAICSGSVPAVGQ